MKVSIIIPVYNVEPYLNRCIESILSQSYDNLELLLVNDGSTDASGSICDTFSKQDGRVKVFHQQNGGVSAARNTGLNHSTGEWICFVDSDDWVESSYLDNFLNNGHVQHTDLIVGGYRHHMVSRRQNIKNVPLITQAGKQIPLSYAIENLEENNYLTSVWGKLFSKEIILGLQLKFDKRISFGEDTLFMWEYLATVKNLQTVEVADYHYMERDNTGSLTYQLDSYDNIMYINKRILELKKLVADRFGIRSATFLKKIENEYLMLEMRAVISMYTTEFRKDKTFRKSRLQLLAASRHIRSMPDSTPFTKIFKLLLSFKKVVMLDQLLNIKARLTK